MGVSIEQRSRYMCDDCKQEIRQDEVYEGDTLVLWSDRDVTATASIRLSILIPYSSQPNICCKRCAARLLDRFLARAKFATGGSHD